MEEKNNWRRQGIEGKEPFFLIKDLALDENRKVEMHVVKLDTSTKYPVHKHPLKEWIYILKGEMTDQNGTYKQGDLLINEVNSEHQVTSGANGTELLAFKFLEENQ